MDLYHYSNEELASKLQESSYDLIGVGFMAARFKETVVGLCEAINENKKNAWLILGGQGPTPIPDYMLRTTKADVVVMSEADETICDLLRCKIENGDRSKVDGIAYWDEGEVVINRRRKILMKLDELPWPAWDVFPIDDYARSLKLWQQEPGEYSLAIDTARGCIASCAFCYRMEKGIRKKSISRVIEEINYLYHKYNITNFFILDELFVFLRSRVFEFEKALAEKGLDIKFGCDARVDLLDEEVVRSLKRAGCTFLCIGFESADDNVLKLMNKSATAAKNRWALENILKVGGIAIGLNFLWNNPGDTEDTLYKNMAEIKEFNQFDQVRTIRPTTPYPGSALYHQAIENGLIKGPEEFFDRFINSDLITINFMNIPTERCYELLLDVNGELIRDYFRNLGKNAEEGERMIQQFADL